MNEDEFDAKFAGRPFTTADAAKIEAQSRRITGLAMALFGNDAHLQQQLAALHPEIPPGFELADYHSLLKMIEGVLAGVFSPRGRRIMGLSQYSGAASMWQARAEIVRRAIRYLEGR